MFALERISDAAIRTNEQESASRKLAAGPAIGDAKFGARRVRLVPEARQTAERMQNDFDDLHAFHSARRRRARIRG
jgi:hypothetical protein